MIKMIEKQKGCEGCSMYQCLLYILSEPDLKYRIARIEKCPCKICLVKSMCRVTCEEYAKQFKNKRVLILKRRGEYIEI